jgi:glycosyltransferase involved in cell wall biosynthesis
VKKRGVYDLLRAIPAVVARYPQVKFLLAGDGEVAQVRAEAARLGVADAVETPGWIAGTDKDQALADADVFVLPLVF